MSPHLPYGFGDNDEFHHPISGWLLLERAIAFDGWISWRQALPEDRYSRGLLTAEIASAIITLAQGLHAVHQRMPGYENLDRSPFVFPRWWDPSASDEWASGGLCLFRLENGSIHEFLHRWQPEDSPMRLRQVSAVHLEAQLVVTPAKDLPADHSDAWRHEGTGKRRKPPSRRPGKSASGHSAPVAAP